MKRRASDLFLNVLTWVALVVTVAMFAIIGAVVVAGVTSCVSPDKHPKLAAGQTALIQCAATDFIGMVGDVTQALMADDYEQKLEGLGSKDELRKDAVSCAVKAVNAVVTAKPANAPSTSQPSALVLHSEAFLADKHFAPEAK